jgi:hypothetical protein
VGILRPASRPGSGVEMHIGVGTVIVVLLIVIAIGVWR